MVVGVTTSNPLAPPSSSSTSEAVCNDIVFVVEGSAACGAYMSELKSNYIAPTVEYFNGGPVTEDRDCGSESFATLYTLVVYHASDRMPASLVDIYGPFRNPFKFLQLVEKLDYSGGEIFFLQVVQGSVMLNKYHFT